MLVGLLQEAFQKVVAEPWEVIKPTPEGWQAALEYGVDGAAAGLAATVAGLTVAHLGGADFGSKVIIGTILGATCVYGGGTAGAVYGLSSTGAKTAACGTAALSALCYYKICKQLGTQDSRHILKFSLAALTTGATFLIFKA